MRCVAALSVTAGTWQLPYDPCTKRTVDHVEVNGSACTRAEGCMGKLVTKSVGRSSPGAWGNRREAGGSSHEEEPEPEH